MLLTIDCPRCGDETGFVWALITSPQCSHGTPTDGCPNCKTLKYCAACQVLRDQIYACEGCCTVATCQCGAHFIVGRNGAARLSDAQGKPLASKSLSHVGSHASRVH